MWLLQQNIWPVSGRKPHTTLWQKGKKRQKQRCTLIHCDSSPREQKNMFCVLHGDSFTFPASSPLFCHFRSASLSLSPYLCPHSLESISCLSKVHLLISIHTPLPSLWPQVHKLWIFPVTDPTKAYFGSHRCTWGLMCRRLDAQSASVQRQRAEKLLIISSFPRSPEYPADIPTRYLYC